VKAVERSELCRLGVPRILGWCSGVRFSEISLFETRASREKEPFTDGVRERG